MIKRVSSVLFSLCFSVSGTALPAWAEIAATDQDLVIYVSCEYVVRSGDTLSGIADRELGTHTRWTEIRDLNPGAVGDNNQINVGRVLTLPCRSILKKEPAGIIREMESAGIITESGDDSVLSEPTFKLYDVGPSLTWVAESGSLLSQTLQKWVRVAGYKLVIHTKNDWRFDVQFEFYGDFRSALEEVTQGFGTTSSAPSIIVYSNKVIILD